MLELKLSKPEVEVLGFTPFNRTMLELKLGNIWNGNRGVGTFNRTMLELKQRKKPLAHGSKRLLIVPCWN